MGLRTGPQYLASLRDGRDIILAGEQIADVTAHPGLRSGAHAIAQFYDFQNLPELQEVMTYVTPSGARAGMAFKEIRSRDDLRQKAAAAAAWSEVTCGFMGRSPDYMNTCLSALAAQEVHMAKVEPALGERTRRIYDEARDRDDCYTHTFIPAFAQRSAEGPPKPSFRIERTQDGVLLTGVRGLATIAPFSNHNLAIELEPYIDEDGAPLRCSFTMPMTGKGCRWVCRDSFDFEASRFDAPMSSRGDEMDATAFFDNYFVPWKDIFSFGKGDKVVAELGKRARTVFTAAKYHNLIRSVAKSRFLFGIAHLVADHSKVNTFANVKERLGEMVHMVQALEAFALAAVEGAKEDPETGIWDPHFETVQIAGAWFADWYPRMLDIIRDVAASRVFTSPDERTMDVVGPLLEQHLKGRPGEAKETVSLYRLALDVTASAWGSRQDLYERFSVGGSHLRRLRDYGVYDKKTSIAMVQRILGGTATQRGFPLPKR